MKAILGGDAKTLAGLVKTLEPEARVAYESSVQSPFLVVRAAGSLGADLVALRHDLGFLIEVKSSKGDLLHFTDSARLVEQINVIRDQCERSGVLPIYAYRLKSVRGDAWRLFTLPEMQITGRTGLLYQRLPKIEKTPKGNLVLRWKNGLPLAHFLAYVKAAPAKPIVVTA
ncbi:MAG TPA: Holliday junction resolvase [Candidatus Thermoplasmatota archaeon]|nr:Holliday junction resolvase [Candidatus Thermoplasmatota archaeon]